MFWSTGTKKVPKNIKSVLVISYFDLNKKEEKKKILEQLVDCILMYILLVYSSLQYTIKTKKEKNEKKLATGIFHYHFDKSFYSLLIDLYFNVFAIYLKIYELVFWWPKRQIIRAHFAHFIIDIEVFPESHVAIEPPVSGRCRILNSQYNNLSHSFDLYRMQNVSKISKMVKVAW